jgi:hypothetical protein
MRLEPCIEGLRIESTAFPECGVEISCLHVG